MLLTSGPNLVLILNLFWNWFRPQQVQYQGNRRLPTVAVASAEDGGPFLRRVDRATAGHSNGN